MNLFRTAVRERGIHFQSSSQLPILKAQPAPVTRNPFTPPPALAAAAAARVF